jgi:CBS domain-containing protein
MRMSALTESRATVRRLLDGKGWVVHSISPDASVLEAIARMAERGIGALVVVEGGKLIGILSERDYTRKVVLLGRRSQDTKVREIMAPPVVEATPEDTVATCMRLLTESRARYLPVLHEGAVVGIVSMGDLIKWTVAEQKETISQLHSYISGGYPT